MVNKTAVLFSNMTMPPTGHLNSFVLCRPVAAPLSSCCPPPSAGRKRIPAPLLQARVAQWGAHPAAVTPRCTKLAVSSTVNVGHMALPLIALTVTLQP
jgi:hypothetical protein